MLRREDGHVSRREDGHVSRREDDHVLRRGLDIEDEGQRKKGRPWKKQVEEESVKGGIRREDVLCRSYWVVGVNHIGLRRIWPPSLVGGYYEILVIGVSLEESRNYVQKTATGIKKTLHITFFKQFQSRCGIAPLHRNKTHMIEQPCSDRLTSQCQPQHT